MEPSMTKEKKAPATAEKPAPRFQAALCVQSCAVYLGIHLIQLFGGDVIVNDQVRHVRNAEPKFFKFYDFADRAAYDEWLAQHDAKVAELSSAAAQLGYGISQHGVILTGDGAGYVKAHPAARRGMEPRR
jgi:hypothetical protein